MPNRPSFSELATQLQQALDAARVENEELTQRTGQAEKRASEAEKRAAEISRKLTILESLKSKEYQTVVTELFEGPSKRAARLTLIVALSSITIGLITTVISNRLAQRKQAETITNLATSFQSQMSEEVNKSEQRTQEDVKQKLHALPVPGVSELQNNMSVSALVSHKGNSYFRISVPEGIERVSFTLTSSKDGDLFVKYNEIPKTGQKDDLGKSCHSSKTTSPDQCSVEKPSAGYWYVLVYGYNGPTDFSLRASY